MENLFAAFASSAALHADKPALFWGEQEFSYRQLADQANAVARRLQQTFGVQPGDRVAIWLRNCPEFVPVLFGILAVGAVVVPINNFLKPAEVSYLVVNSGAKLLVSEAAQSEPLQEVVAANPDLQVWRIEELAAGGLPTEFVPVVRHRSDLAVLIYTSGTTGKPKGAMLTHGNLLHNVESCREVLQVVDLDRFVLLLPMFHSFMLTVCILLPLFIGGSIVLIKSLHPAKAMIEEMLRNRGTVLPAMAQIFRALAGLPAGLTLPLRLGVSGAGPLPAEILRLFNIRFPQIPLIEGYGLSEASPVVSVNPIQGPWHAGTIGVAIPRVELAVQDEFGRPVPTGEVGEICVRGGNVMAGYWNAPEQTAETIIDGWLHTGDLGYRRPDGFYVISDRKKDMLKPNGINVYPREIEEVIHQFAGIRECAVVGEPDERRGERPVAFVALEEGATLAEKALLTFLRERLADYKLPKRVVVLPALPRNATGKILKLNLREQLARERAGGGA
jgi:long-chain acyl-CoA synthetase